MTFTKGQIIRFKHDFDDYGIKAGKDYEVRSNEGVGLYIAVHVGFLNNDNIYLTNGELRQDILDDMEVVE